MRIGLFTDEDVAGRRRGLPSMVDAIVAHRPHDISIYRYSGPAGVSALLHTRDLARQVAADRIDVVHLATSGPLAIAGLVIAARLGLPVVGSLAPPSPASNHIHSAYVREIVRQCRKVLVTSMAARGAFLRAGIRASKLIVWSPGIDTSTFAPAKRSDALRERWGVSDARPAVLYAGTVADDRGAQRLLSLELELYRTQPMHRLIVAGDGPNRLELQARCPNAIFMGAVPRAQMPEVLASGDLFVCPNETCSTNLAVLEAQASGVPVVLMERGSARERVSLSTCVVCRSQADFVVEIAALVRTSARRTAMGLAAREHAAGQLWGPGLTSVYAEYRAAAGLSRVRRDLKPALIPQGRRF